MMAPGRGANSFASWRFFLRWQACFILIASILARNTLPFLFWISQCPCLPVSLLLRMAIWAGNGIVSKLAVRVLSPAALAWSRWMVAAPRLTLFLAHRAWRERLQTRPVSRLAVLALGMVLNQTFGYVRPRPWGY